MLDGKILENRIINENGQLVSAWRTPVSDEVVEWLDLNRDKVNWHEGNIVEISPWRNAWLKTIAEKLSSGAIVLSDYGYVADHFFHPQRTSGTVKCFARQTSNDKYLSLVGLQDITSHVNFSEILLCR